MPFSNASPGAKQGQLALKTRTHQLIRSAKRLKFAELTAAGPAAGRLESQPELRYLERSLGVYLHSALHPDVEADPEQLPQARGDQVHFYDRPSLVKRAQVPKLGH